MDKTIQNYKLFLLNQFDLNEAEKMSRMEFVKLIASCVVSYMGKDNLPRTNPDKQHILSYTRQLLYSFQSNKQMMPQFVVDGLKQEICHNFSHDIQTSLIVCVQKSKPEVVETLIHSGADVNYQDATDKTPLMYAVTGINEYTPEIIDILIKNGADIQAERNDGQQVLHCLKPSEKDDITIAVVNKLIQHNANIYATDNKGYTPLMQAVRTSCVPYVKRIINEIGKTLPKPERNKTLKYCLNQCNVYGSTALFYAILRDQPEMIKLLVNNGADLQLKTGRNCNSPLMEAISEGHLVATKTLIECGAQIDENVLIFLSDIMIQQRRSVKFPQLKKIEKYIKGQTRPVKKAFCRFKQFPTNEKE